ncbi:MAG: carbohydrate-binding family 9-like protein [Abditibacteriota bacterium]|nr:carbohydrate-binding family 9-like protein [Abditibacteriota bacterium]
MKKILLILLVILVSGALYATPEIGIPYMNKPTIDGKIDANEWQGASRVAGFHLLGGRGPEPNKSVVYVGYDDDNFYLAYRFYGPNKPKGVDRGKSGPYWEDDSIEFFLNGDINQESYYQIIANCSGGFVVFAYNLGGLGDGNDMGGKAVDLNVEYKTYISPAYPDLTASPDDLWWEGEISISWKSLGYSPKEGDEGFLFLARDNVYPVAYNSDYGFAVNNFFEKDKYPIIHFLKDTVVARMYEDIYSDFEIYNPTGNEKSIDIINKIIYDGKISETIKDTIKIPAGKKSEFSLKEKLPKSIFTLITEITENGKILQKTENDIINIEMFSYNYDKEKDKIILNFDFTGFGINKYPYVDLRLMKEDNMLDGFMINITEDKRQQTIEIDMSKYEKGKYTLVCWIKGTVNIVETIKK